MGMYIYIYINKTIISACDKENIIKFNNIYIQYIKKYW